MAKSVGGRLMGWLVAWHGMLILVALYCLCWVAGIRGRACPGRGPNVCHELSIAINLHRFELLKASILHFMRMSHRVRCDILNEILESSPIVSFEQLIARATGEGKRAAWGPLKQALPGRAKSPAPERAIMETPLSRSRSKYSSRSMVPFVSFCSFRAKVVKS